MHEGCGMKCPAVEREVLPWGKKYILSQDGAHNGRDETFWMGMKLARGGMRIF